MRLNNLKFNEMKKITNILLLFLAVFAFSSCSEEIEGTDDLNYVSFESNIPKITVEQGESASVTVKLFTTQIIGSDRTFSVEVAEGATTVNSENFTVPETVTIPANSNEGELTISVSDNSLGLDPEILSLKIGKSEGVFTGSAATITIQKTCTLDIDDFVGTYSGDTEGDWGPTQVVTSLDEDGNLLITGIGVSFLTGYWGEVITSMEKLPMNVDMETGDFTIEQAPYITTTWEGDPQPTYYLKASGNLNACTGVMTIYYDFIQEGVGSYVEYFESQTAFTEIISIE